MKRSSLLFLPGRFWDPGKVFILRYFLTVFLSKPVCLEISLMLKFCELNSRIKNNSSSFSMSRNPRNFLKDWKLGIFKTAKMRSYSPALTIVPVIKRGEHMKQILKGNKARREQYIMNGSKKKILLDIVIDVKYLKGKREKRGCKNLGFVVFGVKWSPRKISTVLEEDLLLNHRTG